MSLVIDLKITATDGTLLDIDRLVVQRLTPLTGLDRAHPYKAYFESDPDTTVELDHYYADGAWVLVHKALEKLT